MCSVSMLIHKEHPINSRYTDFQFQDAVAHATQHVAAWQGVTWHNGLCPAGRRPSGDLRTISKHLKGCYVEEKKIFSYASPKNLCRPRG